MVFRLGILMIAFSCASSTTVLFAQQPSMADRGADALSGPRRVEPRGGTRLERFPSLAPPPNRERWTTRLAPPHRTRTPEVVRPNQIARLRNPASDRRGVITASAQLGANATSGPTGGADGVSMHLDNVDIRQVLELLSRTYGKSILVAPEVGGKVTVNFEKVPVDEALDAILKLGNLVAKREGSLLYVYSRGSLPVADVQVRILPLDFAGAEEIMPTVEGMLSSAGKVYARKLSAEDNRMHREALVVSDVPAALQRIEEYVVLADCPPMQVMIEANVLKIDLDDELQHGVNYKQAMNALGGGLEFEATGFADPNASPALFARIQSNHVDGLLHLLKATTDAKTLASPRVMVVNGQRARIQVGNQLGYKVVTVTETAAVEEVKFLEVGIVLEVTPRISRDGRVMMRVKPKVSDGAINANTLLPEEQTSEIESDVLLADGQGVVIGGLIQERDNDVQQKIPVLGDLYMIGRLFQKRLRVKERSEIVVTLVPRIVNPGDPATERDIMNAERSQTPLLDGPLIPTYRPWEPKLPDASDKPYYHLHGCGLFRNQTCDCGQHQHQHADKPPLEQPPQGAPHGHSSAQPPEMLPSLAPVPNGRAGSTR